MKIRKNYKNLLKSIRPLIIGIAFVLIPVMILVLKNPKQASANWIDDAWHYRKKIVITKTTAAQTNVYVAFDSTDVLDTSSTGKFQTDCGDIRFTKFNGEVLPYYINSGCGTSSTDIDVYFDSIPIGSNVIYMYYGNQSAGNGFSTASFSTEATNYTVGTPGSEEKAQSPVLYFKFDEGASDTCNGTKKDTCNADGNSKNDGAISGAAWQGQDMCLSGNCLYFDGSDDSVSVPRNNSTDFGVGLSGGLTFSGWVRVNSDGENNVGEILNKGTSTYLRVTNEGSDGLADLEASLDLGSSDATATVTNGITLNKWHYVAMGYTDDGDDEISVYIDGALAATSSNGSGVPTETNTPTIPTVEKTITSTTSNADSTTFTMNMPTIRPDNDLYIAVVAKDDDDAFSTVPSKWTQIANLASSTTVRFGMWYWVGKDEPATYSIVGDLEEWSGGIIRLSGVDIDDIINQSGTSSGTSATPTSPAVTPDEVGTMILYAAGIDLDFWNTSSQYPSGTTGLFSVDSNTTTETEAANAAAAYKAGSNGVSSGTGAFASNGSDEWASATAAINGNTYLNIGGSSSANFHGYVDEFKVYNYERSATQVKTDATKYSGVSGVTVGFGPDQSYASTGLAGYWKLNESSGNASDSSGNGLTLTNNGTTTYVTGKFANGSEHVPASSQYLSTATAINNLKSVSFWVNPDSTTNYYISLTTGAYITSSSGTLSATGFTNPKIYVNDTETSTIVADTWQLVTVTTETEIDANQFYVGRQGSNYFDGTLDEVKVFNRTLSKSEIEKNITQAAAPLAHWKFDENRGTAAYDSSGNALDFGSASISVPTVLANGSNSTTASQTITTSSFSPTVGKKVLAFVIQQENNNDGGFSGGISASAGDTPTTASTTSEYDWGSINGYDSQGVLYELSVSSSGARTFTFDANTGLANDYFYSYVILEIDDAPYIQATVANGANVNPSSSTASGTLTLANSVQSNSQVIAFAATANDTSGAISVPGNYTELVNQTQAYTSAGAFYINGPVSNSVTFGDLGQDVGNWVGFILEIGPPDSFSWGNGIFGSGISLNGANDYITRPYDNEFDFGTGEFTASGWFKANSGAAPTGTTYGIQNYTGFEGGDETPVNNDGGIDTYLWKSNNDADVEYINVQGTTKRTGSYALEKVVGDGVEDEWVGIADPDGTTLGLNQRVWTTFYVNLNTQPSSNKNIAQVNLGTFDLGTIAIQWVANTWDLRLDNISSQSSTVTLTQNTWHKIELEYDYDGQDATLYLDDGAGVSVAVVNTWANFTFDTFYIGTNDLFGGIFYVDDLVISTSELDFAPEVYRMDPDGNGNSTAWTNDYANVDEIPTDEDTTYISSSTATNQELVSLESASSAGITNRIRAVKPQALIRDEGGASNIATVIRSYSSDYDQGEDLDPGTTYKSIGNVNETEPSDSQGWQSADLDQLQVGVLNNASVASRVSTISAMVLTDENLSVPSTGYLLSRYDSDQGFKVWMDANGLLNFGIDDDSTWGPDDTASSTANLRDDTWHHFSAMKKSTGIYLYVDGKLVGSDISLAATGTLTSNSAPFTIGSDEPTNGSYFYGLLDDFKIFNYSRNSQQLISDMNGGHPAPGSPIGSTTAYWKFDEGAENTCSGGTNDFCDASGNSIDLNEDNSQVAFTSAGVFSSGLNGNGSAWATVSDNANLDFASSDELTLSIWIKSDASSNPANTEYLINKQSSSAGYALYFNTSGQLVFGIDDDATSFPEDTATVSTDYYDSTWHHVTAVKSGTSSIKLYVDGSLVNTNSSLTATGSLENSAAFYLMSNNGVAGTDEFTGNIDEVQVYRSALTDDQVKVLYNHAGQTVLGALSTDASGTKENSSERGYCPPGDTNATCGPVAYWKLDENKGTTTAYDTAGYQINTLDLTLNSFTESSWVHGMYGSAVTLDGTADSMQRADISDLDFIASDSFTLEMWFKHATASDTEYMITKFASTDGTDGGYQLYMESDGDITCGTARNNTFPTDSATSTAATYDDNYWHHVACVRTGSTSLILYIDGVAVTTDSSVTSATLANDEVFYIGRDNAGTASGYWTGQMDDIKVFRYAKTPAEVAWGFNQGKPAAWWKLDECLGTTAYNSGSRSGTNGTITIGASGSNTSAGSCSSGTSTEAWNNGTTGKRNYSLDFDGTDDSIDTGISSSLYAASQGISFSVWFNSDDAGSIGDDLVAQKFITQKRGTTTSRLALGINNNKLSAYWHDGADNVVEGTTTLAADTWYHATLTYDGATITIYLNGNQENTASESAMTSQNSTNFLIGVDSNSNRYFDGQLDDVKIFPYPLTTAQIKTNYNQGAVSFN